MDDSERSVLLSLDIALQDEAVRNTIDEIVERVERDLENKPDAALAWEPIPLQAYRLRLPEEIRSSWVFILRAGAVTGAERHPNSHQRMLSYRGNGDFQTRTGEDWESHHLRSDQDAPLAERWISIPPNAWHQGVVAEAHWVVVSFQTAWVDELIEERPDTEHEGQYQRRTYIKQR